MKRSNVRLRSNVHIRNPQLRLQEDCHFLPQVRGYARVRALLRSFGLQPHQFRHDDAEVLRLVEIGKLTRAQQEALKWGVPCSLCDSVPCGVDFRGEYKFVCDRPDCADRPNLFVSRRIAVPIADLRQCKHPPEALLDWAITHCNGRLPQSSLRPPFHSIVIRVGSTFARSYTDEELVRLLVYGIQHGQAR